MTDASSATATSPEVGWYYTLSGQRMGPVSGAALRQLLTDRRINGDTSIWKAGMGADWKPLRDTEFGALVADTPPPIAGNQIGNGLVWTVAILPLPYTVIRAILFGASLETGSETPAQWAMVVSLVFAVLNIALNLLDERRLEHAGHGGRWLMAWAVLIPPVYLFMRASRLKQTPSYAIAWIVSLFIGIYIS